jgi:hypothetical protein
MLFYDDGMDCGQKDKSFFIKDVRFIRLLLDQGLDKNSQRTLLMDISKKALSVSLVWVSNRFYRRKRNSFFHLLFSLSNLIIMKKRG